MSDLSVTGAAKKIKEHKSMLQDTMSNLFGPAHAAESEKKKEKDMRKKVPIEVMKGFGKSSYDDLNKYMKSKGMNPSEYNTDWYYKD